MTHRCPIDKSAREDQGEKLHLKAWDFREAACDPHGV